MINRLFFVTLALYRLATDLTTASVTLNICNKVERGNKIFKNVELKTMSKQVEHHFSSSLEYESGDANHRLVDSEIDFKNAFIATALTAYNNHLNLELSPDDIWTLISYGIAQHLGGDEKLAENYRKLFVDHEGKKLLTIVTDSLDFDTPSNNKKVWPQIIAELSGLIKSNTKTNVSDIMTTPFSTSGSVERTVFHCILMDAMKNYFDYKVVASCGIPDVVLHGTINDWLSVSNKLNQLKDIFPDFVWYLNRVQVHVGKLIDSYNRKPDLDWWNTMIFSVPLGSGSQQYLTGWLADFFPYKYNKNERRQQNNGQIDFDDLNAPAVSMTNFTLEDYARNEHSMKLTSGFVGVSQNNKTLALRPVLGWMVYYDRSYYDRIIPL